MHTVIVEKGFIIKKNMELKLFLINCFNIFNKFVKFLNVSIWV